VEFSYQYCLSKKSLKISIFETLFFNYHLYHRTQVDTDVIGFKSKKRLLSLSYRKTQVDDSAVHIHISFFFGGGDEGGGTIIVRIRN